jgi:hypothetical protein
MSAVSFGLACIGCILLSLSLKRHYRQLWPDVTHYQRWYRVAGYACILLSAIPCFVLSGWWIGLVLWVSVLAAAALAQAMLLTYRPQHSAVFGGLGAVLIVAGLLW